VEAAKQPKPWVEMGKKRSPVRVAQAVKICFALTASSPPAALQRLRELSMEARERRRLGGFLKRAGEMPALPVSSSLGGLN
jgi:hypothetical protein